MTDPLVRGVYRPQLTYWPWLIMAAAFPVLGVVTAWLWLRAGIRPLELLLLVVQWVGIALIVSAVLRVVRQADVTDSELRWRAPLRQGTVPLHALRRVRTIFVLLFVAVLIEADDGTRVWFFAQPATSQLVEHLRELAPQLEVGSRFLGLLSSRTHTYARLG
jgi:hypothetical protein